jgi:O-antigen biosynthesis protein WbqV
LGWLSENGIRFLRTPTALELTAYGSPFAAAKEIALEELLSRAPVSLDHRPIYDLLRDKVVLITGAAGSIGSELARQVARAGCAELHLLDVSESGLFEIARELRSAASHCEIFEIPCDIRDRAAVARAFARSGPQLPAKPLARYGAMWRARVASGSATAAELHHVPGHDPPSGSPTTAEPMRLRWL